MQQSFLLPRPIKNLKKFKVLVAAPQNQIKNYAWDEYRARITNLTYNNYDIFLADNSPTKENAQKITKQGIACAWVNPKNKPNQQYIAESLEVIRTKAVNEGYDVLCIVETDIIPPPDFIERLLVHQKHVVSGAYFIGQGANSYLMAQFKEPVGTIRGMKSLKNGADILLMDGKLHQVYSAGMGCILIHREIFTQLKFRWGGNQFAHPHPDSFFAADLDYLNMPQYLDTSFMCKHRNQSWANVADHVLIK